VIYVPPPSAGANRSFNARLQLLANLGFYVLAVNYRGCEGYGAKYGSLENLSLAAEDVLAGYETLVNNPNVDLERIFLSSDSAGDALANALLERYPDYWRAVSMEHPGGITYHRPDPAKTPPILVVTGDQDDACQGLRQFESWAKTNGLSVTAVVYTNSGHIPYRSDQRKDKLDRVARFLISHL
jgi:dipeptidyl aminopeptidase/acylaminoacyl peptidase